MKTIGCIEGIKEKTVSYLNVFTCTGDDLVNSVRYYIAIAMNPYNPLTYCHKHMTQIV